jgi:hypothetical protein
MNESKFKSPSNKFLTLNPGVVLTEHIDPVIHDLDKEFIAAGLRAKVTSGLRDPASQLRIIRTALVNNRLAGDYEEAFDDISGKFIWEGQEVYNWQPGWSKLLNVGFIVNPPFTAKCLMDYYRPGSTENKKGQLIGASPHFRGAAFDIGGGADGINQEAAVIKGAMGKVKGLKVYLFERNQNAIHIDTEFIDMENLV